MRFDHPIHSFPFSAPVANQLAAEFAAQPLGRRMQALRKAAFRELGLVFSGQARHRMARVPATTTRMVWIYTWTTVGDAIMDLAPRELIPTAIEVDLLIAPHLAPLFAHDRRFRRVSTELSSLADDHDFVLLDSLRTTSLRLKTRSFAPLPFATMREHQAGERFDRVAYADRRLRQLFGLAPGEVRTPRIDLPPSLTAEVHEATRIAVALGARVERKRYRRWPQVLERIVAGWPEGMARPQFWLLGQGASARADLDGFASAFLAAHARARVDAGNLGEAARDIGSCAAFLGVDGGLMHVAVGVGTPGMALFSRIEPHYFLRPGSTMQALSTAGDVDEFSADQVADAFLAGLPRFTGAR